MKKRLLFVLATLLIFGSGKAQQQPTHYPFNYHDFPNTMTAIIQIQINGVEQTSSDFELGAFNGNMITGAERIGCYGSHGYYRVYLSVYGSSESYEVTFKLYNHQTEEELDNYVITHQGEPYTFTWASDTGIGSNKKPIVINFTTGQTFTKTIAKYSGDKDQYYLIASPIGEISPENVENMLSNSYDLYSFNQNASDGKEWINMRGGNTPLVPGQGYLYANSGDITLSFTGTPYSGNGEVPLVKTDNVEWSGWNLIGNPFGCDATLDMPFIRLTNGEYQQVQTEGQTVNVMEGVFVQATGTEQAATFTVVSKGNAVEPHRISLLNIKVRRNNGDVIDNAMIRMDGGSALGKFMFNKNGTKIYLPQDDMDFAIVNAEEQGAMPVNFKAERNGNYTISVDAENLDVKYLHLIDNKTGNDVDLLASPSYTFEAKTTDYASRFELVFVCGDANDNHETFAFISNGDIIVSGEGMLQVIDMTGHIIVNRDAAHHVSTNGMTPGVYVLRLIQGNTIKTQKIIIK